MRHGILRRSWSRAVSQVLGSPRAVALASVAGEATPAVAEEILLDVVAAFGPRPLSLDEELALGRTYIHRWWHDWPLAMALAALARLGLERGITALAQALGVVAVPETAHEVVEALLDHAFGKVVKPMSYSPVGRGPGDRLEARYDMVREPPMRQPDTLTRGQRTALTALVACEPFWEIATNLLMLYGLPMSRETLVEWLSAP